MLSLSKCPFLIPSGTEFHSKSKGSLFVLKHSLLSLSFWYCPCLNVLFYFLQARSFTVEVKDHCLCCNIRCYLCRFNTVLVKMSCSNFFRQGVSIRSKGLLFVLQHSLLSLYEAWQQTALPSRKTVMSDHVLVYPMKRTHSDVNTWGFFTTYIMFHGIDDGVN